MKASLENLTFPADLAGLGVKQCVDPWSLAVLLGVCLGFPWLIALHHAGVFGDGWLLVAGTLLMNLSFTAWHEPAHQNLSTYRLVNHSLGWLASLASVYPGYFARRREHLAHHRFQGDPLADPVYPRIQSSFFRFPLQLIRSALRNPNPIPAGFLPLTPAQRNADRVALVLAFIFVFCAFWFGYGRSLLLGWLVPRGLVFWLHAYYICFLPHSVPGGGYELFRNRPRSRFLALLTAMQSYHGVHHAWPNIPWYRYGAALTVSQAKINNKIL